MFAQYVRSLASVFAGGAKSRLSVVASAILLLLSACSSPLPSSYVHSADSSLATPVVTHRSVVRGYISQRPVPPASWLEQNQDVAPRQKQ